MIRNREYLVRVMLFRLLGATIILGAITGFASVSEGAFFSTFGGQIVHGLLSLTCFILVGVVFMGLQLENRPPWSSSCCYCFECRSRVAQSSAAGTVALCESCYGRVARFSCSCFESVWAIQTRQWWRRHESAGFPELLSGGFGNQKRF